MDSIITGNFHSHKAITAEEWAGGTCTECNWKEKHILRMMLVIRWLNEPWSSIEPFADGFYRSANYPSIPKISID